jgi:hypothetical protein
LGDENVEALCAVVAMSGFTADELQYFAKNCHIEGVIRPELVAVK